MQISPSAVRAREEGTATQERSFKVSYDYFLQTMLLTSSPLKHVLVGSKGSVRYKIHTVVTPTPKRISKTCGRTMKCNLLDVTRDGKIEPFLLVDIMKCQTKSQENVKTNVFHINNVNIKKKSV